jgi:hypothetical protein
VRLHKSQRGSIELAGSSIMIGSTTRGSKVADCRLWRTSQQTDQACAINGR